MKLMIFEKKSFLRIDEAERVAEVYDGLTTDDELLFHDLTEQDVDSVQDLIRIRDSYISENGASDFYFFLQIDAREPYWHITYVGDQELINETAT